MPTRQLLSKSLLAYLTRQGYTHMQLRGIETSIDTDDDYILVPRTPSFAHFEESDLPVEPINSSAITDMLDVEFGINFWVELSAGANTFLRTGVTV